MSLKLTRATGLNVTLEGSVGKFRIGASGDTNKSLEVMYLETHIGFDANTSSNEAMLRQLEPVREIFDFKTLGFDELMQRDIDDARVSTQLIPYLLDSSASGTIKFFPPIVVVVLPVADRELRPDKYYPKVERVSSQHDPERNADIAIVRSGSLGSEAFQFEYPVVDGSPHLHDLARLKLNLNKVRLVIIDGQHRAMALLALHRNLRGGWSDARRLPFKEYYREWTQGRIAGFNLADIHLPVVVCTFPDLDSEYQGEYDVIRAARDTFLTLNKTARKVSNSRNILLDDRDLISHFLRDTLGRIKQKDVHSDSSMRIWNVELDQYRDRVKIESPVACTGVSHVYYSIEHMMFDGGDVNGVSPRSGKFHKRAYVEASLLRRLDGENLLGRETAATLKRHTYTRDAAVRLATAYHERFGALLSSAFDTFGPFEFHNKAALELESELTAHANPQIRTILFDGQNIGRTFSDYLEYMIEQEKKAKESGDALAPEIQTILTSLRNTDRAVEDARQKMLNRRAELYTLAAPDRSKLKGSNGDISKNARRLLDALYDNVFTSVAFQAALVCGYFVVVEKAESIATSRGAQMMSRADSFREYIECLNAFFAPTTVAKFKNVIRVFFHELKGDKAEEWQAVPSADTFASVVYSGEMKPDEWPKYRYLLLELWSSADPVLEEVRKAELETCREQVLESLHAKNTRERCVELGKNEQELTERQWKDVFDRSYKAFDGFLRNVGVKPENTWNEDRAKSVLARPQQVSAESDDSENTPVV